MLTEKQKDDALGHIILGVVVLRDGDIDIRDTITATVACIESLYSAQGRDITLEQATHDVYKEPK